MKQHFRICTLLATGLLFLGMVPHAAATDNPRSVKASKVSKSQQSGKKKAKNRPSAPKGKVGRALAKMQFVCGKPAPDADYYIFLQSASWCGPCNAEMPHLLQEYAKMRDGGRVEIVLISHDRSVEKAREFVHKHKAPFATLMKGSRACGALPGYKETTRGIPYAQIVDADGMEIIKGNSAIVLQMWQQETSRPFIPETP